MTMKEYEEKIIEVMNYVRKVGNMSQRGLENIGFDFSGMHSFECNPSWWVINNYSIQEIMDKFKKYESLQNSKWNDLTFGDILHCGRFDCIVTGVSDNTVYMLWGDGSVGKRLKQNMQSFEKSGNNCRDLLLPIIDKLLEGQE